MKNEKKVLVLLMIFVIILVLFAFGINVIFGGAKRVVSNYAKGMKNSESSLIVSLYYSDMIKESYESKEAMIEEYDLMFNEMNENNYRIVRYTVDKKYVRYDGEDLKVQKEQLKKYYDIASDAVEEIRKYTVHFECNDNGKKKDVEHKLIITNIKNKWYLIGTE